ncbi:GyrI-like domain-containing protein [Aminobacter sp. LjRoot7]|uniref:GyrI-like domain-containing protein n=1 Tax=Aminobacter sp. LjRoot7 TaxID=3342335 RepID=UPI003F4F6F20
MPDFELVSMSPRPYAYVSRSCALPQISGAMAASFETLSEALSKARVLPAGPPLAHYREIGDGKVTFDAGFPIREDQFLALSGSGLGLGATAAGQAIRALHIGAYERLADTYAAVLDEMRMRGLEATDDMWESYLSPPGTPPHETTTEVLWPVRGTA